ncbi:MAG: type I 3-dehydroquinate dehydratase [Candidatus Thermoplasmatota archaeon]|jgi:3-dehydroquinate dehydratase type I|nr:type I 3-dehydroquinate dehydratase [Candidatus Thermoplasmatota archaeon]MCL5681328.1 type I 3-dehydroquinate dehydratase [Candidatus Thermoplasmatota archaeon]
MKKATVSKICVSISGLSVPEILEETKGMEMAEIRLDGVNFTPEDIREIFSVRAQMIATCRAGKLKDEDRMRLLMEAIKSGAAYVDIEIDAKKWYREKIIREARRNGCKVILSYHNQRLTPPDDVLLNIAKKFKWMGGDILKIACKANTLSDTARLIGLLGHLENTVVVAMGEKGRISRVVGPLMGAPFTYASLSKGKETAEGQIEFGRLKEIMSSIL